ncbi:hypothetical protein [Peterkaempfera bronchialis]|uniref:hypothetical protein n=1 Tax=Peterkaempfera bronchialis TaxID=2126346 RepID=UPI003C2CEE91
MAGSGYQVQMENLQEFARKVRGLLSEFEAGADGSRTHAGTGVASGSFGPFAEARQLDEKYGVMRDSLRDVLDVLHQVLDEAQQNADATARNYGDQEHGTAAALHPGAANTPAQPSPPSPPSRSEVEKSEKW